MIKWSRLAAAIVLVAGFFSIADAQVNTVEFGKNRVQYQKFTWHYYQTENFNSYFSQDGLEIGKYVSQVAEKELPQLEEFVEYGLQRRANTVEQGTVTRVQRGGAGAEHVAVGDADRKIGFARQKSANRVRPPK